MATGWQAFSGNTTAVIHDAILNRAPTAPVQLNPEVPAELKRIINKALEKDRDLRYQSSADIRADLKRLKRDTDSSRRASQATGETPELPSPTPAPAQTDSSTDTAIVFDVFKRDKKGLAGSLAAVLALAAVIWIIISLLPSDPILAPPTVVPFTSYPGREVTPALSPDGSQIAFSWDGEKGDNFDIYVKLVGAGMPLRLTTDLADDTAPSWSPDGRHIAFCRRSGREMGIFIIPALGGAERKLHSGTWVSGPWSPRLSWSPDGKTLAFSEKSSTGDTHNISLLSVESLEKRKLTSPGATHLGDFFPAFSTNGRILTFARFTDWSVADLHDVPVSGGEPRRPHFF